MVFQPLTYRGQYPPLTPRSPSDIKSFDLIHSSLRALPELAKEGDKILNEEMLAKLVDGAKRFQEDHLGRKSKPKYWPCLRLPSPLFSDRSSHPNGPLATAILSAFRFKQTSSWRNFNFDNPKLFDDNIAIIKKMEGDLLDRGFLKRPVIYFDATVEEGLGKVELQSLTKIAQRFGAVVMEDPKEVASTGRVTHIVAYDPEEHDAMEVIEEEERREKGGEETEKTYLKTLALVDMPIEYSGASADDIPQTKKMALVHWWYHPSSYDEYLPAEDVAGEVEEEFHPGIKGGPAVVGCKFVRDVEKFNEWGLEADYAVMEFEKKIAYLRKESNNKSTTSSKKSKKKRNNGSTAATPKAQSVLETLMEEPIAKKKKVQKEGDAAGSINNGTMLPSMSKASSLGSSITVPTKSKSANKTSSNNGTTSSILNTTTTIHTIQTTSRQPSERRKPDPSRSGGMDPRRILTGMRGLRNEAIRRTVYDGALRVEEESYKVVKEALGDYYLLGSTDSGTGVVGAVKVKDEMPLLSARPEWRKLLPPTGFIRPSVDASLEYLTVTELTMSEDSSSKPLQSDEAVAAVVPAPATVMAHYRVPILLPLTAEAPATGGDGGAEEPLSMRGGGLENEADAVQQEPVQEMAVQHEPVQQPSVQQEMGVAEIAGSSPPSNDQEKGKDGTEMEEVIQEPDGQSPSNADLPPTSNLRKEVGNDENVEMAEAGQSDVGASAGNSNVDVAEQLQADAMEVDEAPAAEATESVKEEVAVDVAAVSVKEVEGVANMETSTVNPSVDQVDANVGKEDNVKEEVTAPAESVKEEVKEDNVKEISTVNHPPGNQTGEGAGEQNRPSVASVGALIAPPSSESKPMVVDSPRVEATESIIANEKQTVVSVAQNGAAVNDNIAMATDTPQETNKNTTAAEKSVSPPMHQVPGTNNGITNPVALMTAAPATPAIATKDNAAASSTLSTNVEKVPVATSTSEAASKESVAATPQMAAAPTTATSTSMKAALMQQKSSAARTQVTAPAVAATAAPAASSIAQAPPTQASTSRIKATTTESSNKQQQQQQQQPVICQVVSLPPGTQLSSSLYRPSAAASTEEDASKSNVAYPTWYDSSEPSEFERRSLPEWFNHSSPHRTSASYVATREKIVDLAKRNSHQYITATAIRRSVTGDAGSLLRLHKFLMGQGLLNGSQIGETAPSDAALRGLRSASSARGKRKHSELVWSTQSMQALEAAVVKYVSRQVPDNANSANKETNMSIDWDAVAADVGGGVTAADCQRAFLQSPGEDDATTIATDASTSNGKSIFSQILDSVRPEVLNATISASLQSTSNLAEARNASFIASLASTAALKASQTEDQISNTLMDIIDQRVQRLENRAAILDDVEALLEAERVALEIERRDMYTSRCRHWFGDGSS